MYGKIKRLIIVIACLCLCSCVCTKHRTEPELLEHQRQIDRTEESVRARDRAIEECLRELSYITARSEEMGGDIEDIIRELDEYQRAVQQLLRAAGYTADEEQTVEKSSYKSD